MSENNNNPKKYPNNQNYSNNFKNYSNNSKKYYKKKYYKNNYNKNWKNQTNLISNGLEFGPESGFKPNSGFERNSNYSWRKNTNYQSLPSSKQISSQSNLLGYPIPYYQFPMITNYPSNPTNSTNSSNLTNQSNSQLSPIPPLPYFSFIPCSPNCSICNGTVNLSNKSTSIINPNFNSLNLSEYNNWDSQIQNFIENQLIKPKPIEKEYKWICFDINTLDDLIEISRSYGTKYSKDFEYQLDLELLSKMTEELESLNKLVGLGSVKNQIVDLILYYSLKLDNKNHDLLHTVIEGEPGTGKTELAEKLAKIYLKMGVLKKDVFKKVKRSDLVAGYLGQTAIKTEKILEECRGGVLFIDEAYSLGNPDGKDGKDIFSKECIDMINQWLTENKSEFICIIAGYSEDLAKSFFSYNAGLERRFPIRFKIDPYSDEELGKIFIKKVIEHDWQIDCENLSKIIKTNRKYFKFNGGDMEILFTKAKISHSKNLLKTENKKKKVLTEKDITDGVKLFLTNPEIIKRADDNLKKYIATTMYS